MIRSYVSYWLRNWFRLFSGKLGILTVMFYVVVPANAWAFVPLELCPDFTGQSPGILEKKLKKTMNEGDRIDIETYMALMQCQIGTPHAIKRESYILLRSFPPVSFSEEEITGKLETLIKPEEFFQIKNIKEIGSFKDMRDLTDLLRAALLAAHNRPGGRDYKGLAEDIGMVFLNSFEQNNYTLIFKDTRYNTDQLNAEAGLALIELARVTGNGLYRDLAYALAETLKERELVLDFTVNAANAALFASLAGPDRNNRQQSELNSGKTSGRNKDKSVWVNTAARVTQNGVFPALIERGDFSGFWVDPITQSRENRYDMIRYMLPVLRASQGSKKLEGEVVSHFRLMHEGIYKWLERKKGLQLGDDVARMMCDLSRHDPNSLADLKKSHRIRAVTAINAMRHDAGKSKPEFLRSRYSILCMMMTDFSGLLNLDITTNGALKDEAKSNRSVDSDFGSVPQAAPEPAPKPAVVPGRKPKQ